MHIYSISLSLRQFSLSAYSLLHITIFDLCLRLLLHPLVCNTVGVFVFTPYYCVISVCLKMCVDVFRAACGRVTECYPVSEGISVFVCQQHIARLRVAPI